MAIARQQTNKKGAFTLDVPFDFSVVDNFSFFPFFNLTTVKYCQILSNTVNI